MSNPQFKIRRIYVNAGSAEDIIAGQSGTDQEAPPPMPPPPPKATDAEPSTPQEMTAYLLKKEAYKRLEAEAVSLKGTDVDTVLDQPAAELSPKKHQVMPPQSERPDTLPKPGTETPPATADAAPKAQMKVVAPDGTVHKGNSLVQVAKSVVGKRPSKKPNRR